MQQLLLFHCNNGCTNVPQCYVIRTLPVLFIRQYSLRLLKLVNYNYNNQAFNYLLDHNISISVSYIQWAG